jgi:heme/copper-type cytochrome/quinol oxidase subunit 3
LAVSLFRVIHYHFSQHHHNGFEAAIWYWHLVDAIWVFLYIFIYIWSAA